MNTGDNALELFPLSILYFEFVCSRINYFQLAKKVPLDSFLDYVHSSNHSNIIFYHGLLNYAERLSKHFAMHFAKASPSCSPSQEMNGHPNIDELNKV